MLNCSCPSYVESINPSIQSKLTFAISPGEIAPGLKLKKWLRGNQVTKFEDGKVYIIEFWATWCKPCVAALPRLSQLTKSYGKEVVPIAVNVYEPSTRTAREVEAFVDSLDLPMKIGVAMQQGNAMVTAWIEAADEKERGIPISFVVNQQGRVAWIGHPKDLEKVLHPIVQGKWDVAAAAFEHDLIERLDSMDQELYFNLATYRPDPLQLADVGKPDSTLIVINAWVRKEPKLNFSPNVVYNTMASLLALDPERAYTYAQAALQQSRFHEPPYDYLLGAINVYSSKVKLPPKIYSLAAEIKQMQLDHSPYPELVNR